MTKHNKRLEQLELRAGDKPVMIILDWTLNDPRYPELTAADQERRAKRGDNVIIVEWPEELP